MIERRHPCFGPDLSPLHAEDLVVALEGDVQTTYLYVGPAEDGTRFIAVTLGSAKRLYAAIGDALSAAEYQREGLTRLDV